MAREMLEGEHVCTTAEEARACRVVDESEKAIEAQLDKVRERLGAEGFAIQNAVDAAIGELVLAQLEAVHARLCHFRPDLGPLFVFALWPDCITMPSVAGPDGCPLRMTAG